MPLFTISELTDTFAVPTHEQILDVSGMEPVLSEPVGEWTAFVRLESDEDCYVAFGEDPVAILGNFPVPCCTPIVIQAEKGMRISVLNQNAPPPIQALDVDALDQGGRINPADDEHDH